MKTKIFTILLILITLGLSAQVSINTDGTDPNPSAGLDVKFTDKGFLPPRMTEAQRNTIATPAAGLIVWCTNCGTDGELQVYNGTTWTNMIGGIAGIAPIDIISVQVGADIDGEAEFDQGHKVSLSANGTRVAIGAPFNDGNGSNSGHVRVYDWNGSAWIQAGTDIEGEAAGDQCGYSVSLSADGSRVAIGAYNNDGNGSGAGHVRIYDWNGSAWIQVGVDIDGEAAGDLSGVSVSLSTDGTRLAIGAQGNDENGSNAGHVRIYDWNGSAWLQVGADIDGEAAGDSYGNSVSLSSDGARVAIGAPYNDGNGDGAGHVRIYDWNGSAWVQAGADIDGEAADDYSGTSISLSANGSRLAIGAQHNGGNGSQAGHVRIYDWNGTAWVQAGVDIDAEAAGDKCGSSVSLSADGSRVAIGARENDGTDINSGHVRIYNWNGSTWIQIGLDIDGEAIVDQSGGSVSFSADGTRVAIGAYANAGNGAYAGHVRVYE